MSAPPDNTAKAPHPLLTYLKSVSDKRHVWADDHDTVAGIDSMGFECVGKLTDSCSPRL